MNELNLLTLNILSCSDCGDKDISYSRKGERKESWRVKGIPKDATRLTDSSDSPVPGSGPANARVVVVGEAPGAEEDKTGEPFVGRSGKVSERDSASDGWCRPEVRSGF